MAEKYKLPQRPVAFDIYQRVFVNLITTHSKEWVVPKKHVVNLNGLQEEWLKDNDIQTSDAEKKSKMVHKRNETMARFISEIEYVLDYYLIENDSITPKNKVIMRISGF